MRKVLQIVLISLVLFQCSKIEIDKDKNQDWFYDEYIEIKLLDSLERCDSMHVDLFDKDNNITVRISAYPTGSTRESDRWILGSKYEYRSFAFDEIISGGCSFYFHLGDTPSYNDQMYIGNVSFRIKNNKVEYLSDYSEVTKIYGDVYLLEPNDSYLIGEPVRYELVTFY